MDHTIALIEKSHNGDKEAREQLVEENIGLVLFLSSAATRATLVIPSTQAFSASVPLA